MKKLTTFLFLTLICFQCIVAENYFTTFDSPFNELHLDSCWAFDEQDTNSVSFEHCDDWEIEFSIEAGQHLKKKTDIEKLYKQIKKAKGEICEVPLLVESFPWLSYLDLLDLDIQLEDYQIIKVNGLEGIKAYHKVRLPIAPTSIIDEPDWTVFYIFIVNQRIYSMDFSAPASKFLQMESFFDTTIKNLFQ